MSTDTHRALLPLPRPLVSNVSARLEIQGQLLYSFSAYLSFCFDICWPCKLVQNILWTNCKLSKYMFKGKQAKSSLSSNLCVKLISQKSKKVKLYQVPRHRQQTSKHSCGEGRSTQLRITSTLEGNTYFYSEENYLLLLWREILHVRREEIYWSIHIIVNLDAKCYIGWSLGCHRLLFYGHLISYSGIPWTWEKYTLESKRVLPYSIIWKQSIWCLTH